MTKLFTSYIILINLLGFLMMGIDKRKARKGRWRIPERTLFLTAFLGGSAGCLLGMYLFRHKTRQLRFSIGLPTILVLQVLIVAFILFFHRQQAENPSAAVSRELELIRELDENTIKNFVSYENLMSVSPSSADIGPETTEAVELFFKNFQYHLHSETIDGDTATVTAEIINIDTQALARDLCRTLTAHNVNIFSDSQSPESVNDYFTLLRDTLKANTYGLSATTAYFHLTRSGGAWIIQADETLQDQLVSGFISWINDPRLLSPEDVITIYMDEFSSLSARQWQDYLKTNDIFSTDSDTYSASIDQAYTEKIAEYFDYSIIRCETLDDSTARAELTVTSLDMPHVLEVYEEKLLGYARTSESITSDSDALTDATARYLLEALQESGQPADFQVTITLTNDGHSWHPDLTEEVTNALLGDISGALEAFNAS